MDEFRDPSLVLYVDLAKHDSGAFQSDDQYGLLCTRFGAVWKFNHHTFDGSDDRMSIVDSPRLSALGALTFFIYTKLSSNASGAVYMITVG